MEVSFSNEARMLRRGAGEVFHGEGILAITKALLQSGVAYVGGYQGAPVSHLLDVLVSRRITSRSSASTSRRARTRPRRPRCSARRSTIRCAAR